MATADELATFGRERQLADRAYNEALTELDQAIAATASRRLRAFRPKSAVWRRR